VQDCPALSEVVTVLPPSLHAPFTLAVIGVATFIMARDRLAPDVTMFSALCVLVVTGVLEPESAMSGFASPAVATIAVLFVCAAAIKETGALHQLSEIVFGGTRSPQVALARLVIPTAAVSGFMNNAPIVAMFIPMVRSYARRLDVAPSRFLIPLSYASMLGGTCTLIGTSANLVVASMHAKRGLGELQMLDITMVGVPITLVALVYLVLVAPRLLPDRTDPSQVIHDEQRDFLAEVEVAYDSPLLGKTIEQAGLRHLSGLFLVELRRADGRVLRPVAPEDRLQAGDHLVFTGMAETVVELAHLPGLSPVDEAIDLEHRIFEVVVSPRSPLVGLNVRDAEFRRRYDAAILAVHRSGERLQGRIGDFVLRPGDTLMLLTSPGFGKTWRNSAAFYLVSEASAESAPRYQKAGLATLTLMAMVAVPALTTVPLLVSAMAALVVLIFTKCIDGAAARQSISWGVVVLIGSAIGVSNALEASGGAEMISEVLLTVTTPFGPRATLAGVYVLGAVFASFVSNAAAAALVFPIAMGAAEATGMDTRAVALGLALAASAGFATPIGSNPNLLVYGPGGYRYLDFTRVGLPLTLICMALAVTLLPIFYPLT
jgi:di/tricarboxylate transporter